MTDDPIWPGVAEYLYQAATPELVRMEGTWIVPSELTPRRSRLESTPMAGMCTDTGSERGSQGPRAEPVMPATDREGCGACTWAATPATRARRLFGAVGGGAYPASGQETTTRNPATRRHAESGNVAVPSSWCATPL